MSKNISIAEGGVARQFTNDKLKINLVGGGTEYYVPESGVQLTTKSVTANGTYTAAADDKYGFSQFSVNVRGGNGSADSHGKPTGGDIKPGGAGSAVVGTDPETGNDVVVGVDEDGQLVNTPLPSSIVLVTPPTKTDYNDGETIDLSGAVVVAKMADGTTWTDADHPNGHVSCTPEPAVASGSGGGGNLLHPIAYIEDYTVGRWPPEYTGVMESEWYVPGFRCFACEFEDGSHTGYAVSSQQPSGAYAVNHYGDGSSQTFPLSATEKIVNGVPVYVIYGSILPAYIPYTTTTPMAHGEPNDYDFWSVVYSGGSAAQTITLNWARPVDEKVLSTTMQIEITGSSHTTESSSGTEGSGGGGEF